MRAIVLVCVAVLCTTVEAAAQEYYSIPIEDGGVAFLLDVSGSMKGRGENGAVAASAVDRAAGMLGRTPIGRSRLGQAALNRARSETTKLGAARRALMRALGSLKDGTSFTVITFGKEAHEWPGGERPSGRAATLFAQTFVAALSADGDTPMAEALRIGFGTRNVRTLFVVSDGRPTTGEVRDLVRQLQQGRKGQRVIINTIGVGDDQDPQLLCELATENGGVYVRDGEIACAASPCPADPGLVTYYPPGPNRHDYANRTVVCSVTGHPGCTPELVYRTMLSEARFQAPTRDRGAVTNCQNLDLRISDWSSKTHCADKLLRFGVGSDPVSIVVDRENRSATNYTRPGHRFHPGKISRTVKQEGDVVIVETVGTGTGPLKSVNEEFGPVIFGCVDLELVEAVIGQLTGWKVRRK
ncbi:MAG TPA: VWA domain-containing protein [Thermoanaerobaculia bacterium]|jgi:hypothetical protein